MFMFALFVGPSITEDVPAVAVLVVFHITPEVCAEDNGPIIRLFVATPFAVVEICPAKKPPPKAAPIAGRAVVTLLLAPLAGPSPALLVARTVNV